MLHQLIVDTFEASVGTGYPVLRHIFYGKTKEEARGYYQAHLTTDAFLRGCTLEQHFKAIKCRSTFKWKYGPIN